MLNVLVGFLVLFVIVVVFTAAMLRGNYFKMQDLSERIVSKRAKRFLLTDDFANGHLDKFPRSEFLWQAWCDLPLAQQGGPDYEEGLVRARRYCERFPRSAAAQMLTGRVLVSLGRPAEAEQAFAAGMKGRGEDKILIDLGLDYASVAEKLGNNAEAQNRLLKLQRRYPNIVTIPYNLGRLQYSQRAYDAARPYLDRALQIDPKYYRAMRIHAMAAVAQCQWDAAAKWWARLLAAFDQHAEGYLRGAEANYMNGDRDRARALLKQCSFIFSADPAAMQEVATLRAKYDAAPGA